MEWQSRWTAPVVPFSPLALILYCLCFVAHLSIGIALSRSAKYTMARSIFVVLNGFLLSAWTLLVFAQSLTPAYPFTATATATAATTSYRAIPTLPLSAQFGQNVLPNIMDPEAIDPQSVCSGYTASNIVKTATGL